MGVVLACPPCFLGFGVLLVSRFFLPSCGLVVGGGGSGCRGVFSGSGLGAPGSSPSSCWGWVGCVWRVRLLRFCAGVGCVCAWFLTSLVWGWGWVRVRLVHSWDAVSGGGSGGPAPFSGVGCAWFPVRVRGGFRSCSRRGFRVFLFPLGASFLWFGGCRVGLGLFFLRLFCPVRVRVGSLLGVGRGSGSGVGFVWRV